MVQITKSQNHKIGCWPAVASDCIGDIFAVFDVLFDAFDTTSDNPSVIAPTNMKVRPTWKKKKKRKTKKQKKATQPKTRSAPNLTHMPVIIDNDTTDTVMPTIIKEEFNHDEFTATIHTIEEKSGTTTPTEEEEDEVRHTIDDVTIDDEFTTSTSTTTTTTTEEDPPTTITPPKTKTTGEEEFPILSGIFNIDNELTTSNTTEEEEEDEKSNNYYDYIDNKIFQNEESPIVFEESFLAPATIRTDNPNNIIIEDLLTIKRFDSIVGILKEDTLDFLFVISLR